MGQLEVKNFQQPYETRKFEGNGYADMLVLAGKTVGRGTFEPGWRWSRNVKPIAGTDRCEVSHLAFCVSGRMRITMSDGTEGEIGAGDVAAIPPGHDAEVLGDESCVLVDFGEISEYAKPA